MGGGNIFNANHELCRQAIVDTGSPLDLEQTCVEEAMTNAKASSMKCVSASGDTIKMSKHGDMLYTLPDTLGEGGEFKMVSEIHTSHNLPIPLFSVDKLYKTGEWDFLLRDSKRGGPAFIKYDTNNQPTNCIPLSYDYENKCTWITYGVGGKGGQHIKQNKNGGEGQPH